MAGMEPRTFLFTLHSLIAPENWQHARAASATKSLFFVSGTFNKKPSKKSGYATHIRRGSGTVLGALRLPALVAEAGFKKSDYKTQEDSMHALLHREY